MREDILQETLLHLWKVMADYPDKHAGGYLTSRSWYIKDLLRRGRSLDSPKNRSQQCNFEGDHAQRLVLELVRTSPLAAAMLDPGGIATSLAGPSISYPTRSG